METKEELRDKLREAEKADKIESYPIIFKDFDKEELDKKRYEISKDVVCSIMGNFRLYSEFEEAVSNDGEDASSVYIAICHHAIVVANELLKQLTNK